MMDEPNELKQLHLDGMADAWLEQHKNTKLGTLAFDDRFGLLVDAEVTYRENRRLKRLLREAKPKLPAACIEDIDYAAQRHLDKAMIRQLTRCGWVQQAQTIVITGATGHYSGTASPSNLNYP